METLVICNDQNFFTLKRKVSGGFCVATFFRFTLETKNERKGYKLAGGNSEINLRNKTRFPISLKNNNIGGSMKAITDIAPYEKYMDDLDLEKSEKLEFVNMLQLIAESIVESQFQLNQPQIGKKADESIEIEVVNGSVETELSVDSSGVSKLLE